MDWLVIPDWESRIRYLSSKEGRWHFLLSYWHLHQHCTLLYLSTPLDSSLAPISSLLSTISCDLTPHLSILTYPHHHLILLICCELRSRVVLRTNYHHTSLLYCSTIETMASNPIFALLWLILLLVLAWPVAFLCAVLWVLFMVSRGEVGGSATRLVYLPLTVHSSMLSLLLKSRLRHVVGVSEASTKLSRTLPDGQLSAVRQLSGAILRVHLPHHKVGQFGMAVAFSGYPFVIFGRCTMKVREKAKLAIRM